MKDCAVLLLWAPAACGVPALSCFAPSRVPVSAIRLRSHGAKVQRYRAALPKRVIDFRVVMLLDDTFEVLRSLPELHRAAATRAIRLCARTRERPVGMQKHDR